VEPWGFLVHVSDLSASGTIAHGAALDELRTVKPRDLSSVPTLPARETSAETVVSRGIAELHGFEVDWRFPARTRFASAAHAAKLRGLFPPSA
jgi:hypothetical protein